MSSLHEVFSLCTRVGWCDVCTNVTNLIKVDVLVNEMPLLNIYKRNIDNNIDIFLSGMCLFC